MQPTKKCVFCDAVARYQRIEHVEVIGTVKVVMPSVVAYHCDTCGEDDLSLEQLTRLQQQAALTALIDLPKIDGKTFRATRKSLGLTQVALASFMGSTPETVSRWESGALDVSRQAQVMLLSAVMLVQKRRPVVAPSEPVEPAEALVSADDPPLSVAC